MSPEAMEGKLNAYRGVLISLLSVLVDDEKFRPLFEELDNDTIFQDGEEDPGTIPSEGYATDAAAAAEIRSLIDAAKARAKYR